MTGNTNKPAPQNRNESDASGAAALPTVIEYGIMYGQNNTASVANADRKNSTVIANGQPSRRRRAPAKTPTIASKPITGKIKPQARPRNAAWSAWSRSAIAAMADSAITTSAAPARRGTLG